jgi:hypothetical protein
MLQIFGHPLFVALVGLSLTVCFAPWLARSWQDRQGERDLRTDLVADISNCVMELMAKFECCHPGTVRADGLRTGGRS